MSLPDTYTHMLKRLGAVKRELTPYARRLVRFMALPYCYFFQINWRECTASRLRVALDLLYIFFELKYYPDNYSPCRLYEKPRCEWPYYYGSGYDPYQRHRLRREVQPQEYQILFENKEVCHQLCRGNELPVPRMLGALDPREEYRVRLAGLLSSSSTSRAIIKPVLGSAGQGICLAERQGDDVLIRAGNQTMPLSAFVLRTRCIVQEIVSQHPELSRFSARSLNTIRALTLYTMDGDVLLLAASMRFGVGDAFIDNWSAGGVALGVDIARGELMPRALDKLGRLYTEHPTSGVCFGGFPIPCWPEILELGRRCQSAFPYYRLLGLDLAVSVAGPVLIEINAFPDLAAQEQGAGPLLANPRNLREFARYNLLINKHQRRLAEALGCALPASAAH